MVLRGYLSVTADNPPVHPIDLVRAPRKAPRICVKNEG